MRRLRIGIDIDGTVCDNNQRFLDIMNKATNKNLTLDDQYTFSLEELYGVSREFVRSVYTAEADYVFGTAPALEGAVDVITRLRHEGAEVLFVTARDPRFFDVTVRWLRSVNMPYDRIVLEPRKEKAVIKYEIDVFVDDCWANAEAVALAGVDSIVFDAPHNRHYDHPRVYRLCNWRELEGLLAQICKAKQIA